ncbi:MAG: Vitamin B12 dependent methionine synthase activation subunit [Butyrivibrio sp.]|nr:Vitamin B12 dependent methionine synthase activation subunit [Butyrivibrio sp.]
MTFDFKEAARYLGYKNAEPDAAVRALMEECFAAVRREAEPKHIYRRFDLEFADGVIKAGGLCMKSRSLERNLAGCREVIFFAATLGSGPDILMNRYSRLSISKAAVLQAVAAAAAESYCNECQNKIAAELADEGLYVRPRFSPGYGDLPLTLQSDFLNVLGASKTVGIYLSEGGIMLPEKSVTALMGLSRENSRCHADGCEACAKADCAYRC